MMALERRCILQEEINQNIKTLRSKRNECSAISAIQYDFEFKSTVGLVNSKTRTSLTDKVNLMFYKSTGHYVF